MKQNTHASNWRHIGDSFGFMSGISEDIRDIDRKRGGILPNLRDGPTILVTSDYGGQHNSSFYQRLSFLFADLEMCGRWNEYRRQIRSKYLPDGRRMSYKNLNDGNRRRALFSFLAAANSIPGLSATFLIHKSIDTFFEKTVVEPDESAVIELSHWSTSTAEKLFRVVHIISMLLAGLSTAHQDVLWLTDEDEIAPNAAKLTELTKLLGNVSSHYLPHNMGHLRCGTTKSDDGTMFIEDTVAVPDLIAGALAGAITNNQPFRPQQRVIGLLENVAPKATAILHWFSETHHPLKRLVCVLDPSPNSDSILVNFINVHAGIIR